ncbi:hypothetical protein PV382_18110 [Streptomyces scabiei]|uniref:hypothetical protein n=1 Tax=Streptomyces scabiei TaxID=1930 RepID=UPI0029AB424E|nr:hypothetical protein [Streptomyces scabiei]MDX2658263.1 hypothetical protein [Streptomyces scabiei]MDX2870548.1 hypothetical protein [Streptomyces scabiei]MDX3174192.1 hypothetical protein [Streptomyces scabiei]
MPRRNRPPQPAWGPRRTGKTVSHHGAVCYLITLAGPRYLTRNPHRAIKVSANRLAIQKAVTA